MGIVGDFYPILEDTDNQPYRWNDQLSRLYSALSNISMTSRDGAIQNYDKAGQLGAIYVVYTSNAVANTQDTIPHTLGYIPAGYIIVGQNKASGPPYISQAFTSSSLFLKTPIASVTWTLMVF